MAIYPRVIYMITHNVTKRMYIGSTGQFDKRIKIHLSNLRRGKHSVEDMQKDFDEYGENYTIEVLAEINIGDSFRKEYDLMNKYRSRIRGVGYNYKDTKGVPRKSGYYNAKLEILRAGMEVSDVAKIMGISTGKLSSMLAGKYLFTLNEAKKFKKAIGSDIPLEELFEEAR